MFVFEGITVLFKNDGFKVLKEILLFLEKMFPKTSLFQEVVMVLKELMNSVRLLSEGQA